MVLVSASVAEFDAAATASYFVLTIVVLFLCSAAMQRITSKGPMLWPVLGIVPTVLYHLGDDIYEWATVAAARAGGTFPFRGMWGGRCHGVVTVDPATIEHILSTRFASFPKGAYFRERFSQLLGDGIFNADGPAWRAQRRPAAAEMHSARFAGYAARVAGDLLRGKLLPLLADLARQGESLDLQEVLLRFAFDNICAAAFGMETGCLGAELPLPEVPFAEALEQATELTLFRFVVPPLVWKTMRWLDIGTERRLRKAVRSVHEFAERRVAERRAELDKCSGSPTSDRSDLLSRLMEVEIHADDEDGSGGHGSKSKFSDKFLKEFCISFLLAGRDTGSIGLAWFFWLLSHHSHVEDLILHELAAVVKSRQSDDPDPSLFTADELERMPYLHASISESLRLYPPVPMDFKEAAEDDVLPDGTAVRKGARVIYSIYSMARMGWIWGDDCREFKPERWLKGGGAALVSESPFKFAVFNAGPRLCVGKRFAYVQMKMVAAEVLWRYRVEVVEGQVVKPKLTTTLYMKHGLRVKFKKRDTAPVR